MRASEWMQRFIFVRVAISSMQLSLWRLWWCAEHSNRALEGQVKDVFAPHLDELLRQIPSCSAQYRSQKNMSRNNENDLEEVTSKLGYHSCFHYCRIWIPWSQGLLIPHQYGDRMHCWVRKLEEMEQSDPFPRVVSCLVLCITRWDWDPIRKGEDCPVNWFVGLSQNSRRR